MRERQAPTDPNADRQDRNVEEPGDTDSADIVGRTGEQMPRQSHDGLESDERVSGTRASDDNVDGTAGRQRRAARQP